MSGLTPKTSGIFEKPTRLDQFAVLVVEQRLAYVGML